MIQRQLGLLSIALELEENYGNNLDLGVKLMAKNKK